MRINQILMLFENDEERNNSKRNTKIMAWVVWKFGHCHWGMNTLQSTYMVWGITLFDAQISTFSNYLLGKQPRSHFSRMSSWRANEVLELVHTYICGSISPICTSGKRYILFFIYDFSKKGWTYFLKENLKAFSHFKQFKKMIENERHTISSSLE